MASKVYNRKDKASNDVTHESLKPLKRTISLVSIICTLFRFLVGVAYVIYTIPILWILLPLRWTNPTLRKLGLENSKLPSDLVQKYWAQTLVRILGVKVKIEGDAPTSISDARIVMYSHASNIDPLIIMGWSPVAVKFIFKQSLMYVAAYIFVLGYLYGHFPINRSNRESAIKSLEKAGGSISKYGRAICIAPEGTRSKSGKLQEFKRGPFHLAKEAEVPIIPVVLFGNYDVWPSGQPLPVSGEVRMRILPEIPVEKEDTVDILSEKVYKVMKNELEQHEPKDLKPNSGEDLTFAIIFAILLGFLTYLIMNIAYNKF